MNPKIFLSLLSIILLFGITSCTSTPNTDEITTEIKKEIPLPQATGSEENTGTEARKNLPTPIPVSKQTKDGVQTRFVEPPVNDMK